MLSKILHIKLIEMYGSDISCTYVNDINDINDIVNNDVDDDFYIYNQCFVYNDTNYALIKEHIRKITFKNYINYVFIIDGSIDNNIYNEYISFIKDIQNIHNINVLHFDGKEIYFI